MISTPCVLSDSSEYELLEVLGEGSNSVVYKARQVDSRRFTQRLVALKLIKSNSLVHLLKQQFDSLKQVSSAHCVNLYGWANFGDNVALVLEYVDGCTLTHLARHQKLGLAEIEEVTRQIQEGLQALYHHNLCHGDLSLGNVLIDKHGRVVLVDFLGTCLADPQGTPAYLSLERWNHQPPTLSHDLFSLGLIRHDLERHSGFGEIPCLLCSCDQMQTPEKDGGPKNPLGPSAQVHPLSRWKSRAQWMQDFSYQGYDNNFFSKNETLRTYKKLRSDHKARKILAQKVRLTQGLHRADVTQSLSAEETQLIKIKRLGKRLVPVLGKILRARLRFVFEHLQPIQRIQRFHQNHIRKLLRWATILGVLFLGLASPSSEGPIYDPAVLEVRVEKWRRIYLNSADLGYTPLLLNKVPPGRYVLRWSSALQTGSLILTLRPKEHKLLTDIDLVATDE